MHTRESSSIGADSTWNSAQPRPVWPEIEKNENKDQTGDGKGRVGLQDPREARTAIRTSAQEHQDSRRARKGLVQAIAECHARRAAWAAHRLLVGEALSSDALPPLG